MILMLILRRFASICFPPYYGAFVCNNAQDNCWIWHRSSRGFHSVITRHFGLDAQRRCQADKWLDANNRISADTITMRSVSFPMLKAQMLATSAVALLVLDPPGCSARLYGLRFWSPRQRAPQCMIARPHRYPLSQICAS